MATGSFRSLRELRDQAQTARDDKIAAEQQAAEQAKKAEAEKERAGKNGDGKQEPPAVVHMSMLHGAMTEDDLLKMYPAVNEQVRQKNYLLQGYVTHDVVLGATTITVRTLRKNEQRVVSLLSEGELDEQGRQIYHPDDLNRWSLVFALTRVGQQNYDVIPMPSVGAAKRFVADTNTKLKELAESSEVAKRLAVIDNWSVPVFETVLYTFIDVSEAYRRAILRDMKNPS